MTAYRDATAECTDLLRVTRVVHAQHWHSRHRENGRPQVGGRSSDTTLTPLLERFRRSRRQRAPSCRRKIPFRDVCDCAHIFGSFSQKEGRSSRLGLHGEACHSSGTAAEQSRTSAGRATQVRTGDREDSSAQRKCAHSRGRLSVARKTQREKRRSEAAGKTACRTDDATRSAQGFNLPLLNGSHFVSIPQESSRVRA
jgi:hypothetical protein